MVKIFADVASYQPSDVTYIANLGAAGIIIKVTEGTYYKNNKAAAQIRSALKAGLQIHLYHYAKYQTKQQAIAEADYFSNFAKELGFTGDCVMVADVEDQTISSSTVYQNTVVFLDRLKALGWSVALYSMASWFWAKKLPTNYPLWVANYGVSQPGVNNVAAWQYTSNYNGMNLDMSYDFAGLFTSGQDTIKSNSVNPDDVITVTAGDAVAFNSAGDVITGSFNTLQKGTQWQSLGIEVIAGEPQYLIGSDYYLPQKYTDQKNIVTIRGDKAHGLRSVDGDGVGWRYSEYYFKGQTCWRYLDTKAIAGKLYYRLSDQDYMSADSVHGSGKG